MINAQLKVIVPVFVASANSYKLLSTTDYKIDMPFSELSEHQDIPAVINMLLARHLANALDVAPKLTDATLTDKITIYYICFVNYETNIINGHLHTLDLTQYDFPPNATKILSLLARH